MFLDDFRSVLLKSSGSSGKILKHFEDKESEGLAFFQPYTSVADPFIRAGTVLAAPICFTIYTAGFFFGALYVACRSLVELVTEDVDTAKNSAKMSASCLLLMSISLLSIFTSMFVNLIDLIGGGVNTALKQFKEEEFEKPSTYS